MNDGTYDLWNSIAKEWDVQVGDEGDANRRLNSDPVLWAFVGDVSGLDVLDAGCGTGYLTRKLHKKGARVRGIDFAHEMIAVCKAKATDLDFRVDSCSELNTVADASQDLVVSNYVLMDAPDLDGTMKAFARVLRPGGCAVLVFSHPCFPQARAREDLDKGQVVYHWSFPYFEALRCVDPPWAHFKSEFIWFHRPLSDYWKAFRQAGFSVEEMEEPRLSPERVHIAPSERAVLNNRLRPFSIAFKLLKPKTETVKGETP